MVKLKVEENGGYYVLNGSKMWLTNGPDADTQVVYAKAEPKLGVRGVTAFLVEKGMPDFSIAQKLDMRGSHTSELVFRNVEVPAGNVLGAVNGGAGTGHGEHLRSAPTHRVCHPRAAPTHGHGPRRWR